MAKTNTATINLKEINKKIDEKRVKVKRSFNQTIKDFIQIIKKPELRILPGQIAFYFLMSLIPIIAIIALIASFINKNFNLLTTLESAIPKVLADIVYALVNVEPTTNIVLIIICYIWLASNGTSSITIAADTLYGIEAPNYIKLKLKSIIMILIMILLLTFIICIPVFGDIILESVLKILNRPTSFDKFVNAYHSLKYITTFIIVFLNIKLLFTIAPDKTIKSKHTTYGALFTSISWLIVTEIFAFYITNIAKYNLVYGNFANILILLLWIYLLAYLLVFGLAINVNKDEVVK